MSLVNRWKLKHGVVALPIVAASILLAAPAAQAHVGIGLNFGFPPIVVSPPVVAGPPAYYAPPPGYYYAPPPSYGFFWYDHFGHRHWHHR